MTMRTIFSFTRRLPFTLMLALAAVNGIAAEETRARPEAPRGAEIVEVKKIWDAGGHNAFTDLIRWRERWWCTFREAAAHVGGDGVIRVITSADGAAWESAAALAEQGVDLRDPKFSVTPEGRLMLVCGGSIYAGTKVLKGRRPRVLFSDDGRTWTAPQKILEEGDWLWRVTWHEGIAYGVSYRPGKVAAGAVAPMAGNEVLVLCKSRDGVAWSELAQLDVPDRPNETTLRFLADGRMVAMVRREAGNKLGWFGEARAPYTQWTWRESNMRFGGPDFLELPDGRLIAGTREYPPVANGTANWTTIVASVEGARLEKLVTLPSGGDTSYQRLVWHDGLLWVSYYSSHEGKTAIYLAKLRLPERADGAAKRRE